MTSATETVETDISTDAEGSGSVLGVTPAALEVVIEARASEADADNLALWVEISGVRGDAFGYDIYFQAASDAGPDDSVSVGELLTVVVPADSVDRIRGARLDFSSEGEGGLVMLNPNTPPPTGGVVIPEGDLTSDLALRVINVLAEQINPSIAAHGGRADLVAVDDDAGAVYLRLSGGCQGCGMAKATLSQGIEVALRDAISELTSVVDVTDHADGSNPYYQPSHA